MIDKRIEFIDFAKGYAMLSIVLFHFIGQMNLDTWTNRAIMFGGTGVHLFIFMSGFGLQISGTKIISSFYKKRFFKIYFPYVLFISFLFVFNQFISLNDKANLYAYLGHLLLFNMFDNNIVISFGIQYWFVATIVQFCLIFPFLTRLINNTSSKFFLLISIIISLLYWIAIFYFNVYELRVWNSSFLQFLWEFNLGMFLGKMYKENGFKFWNQKYRVLAPLTIISITVMGILAIKGGALGTVFNDIPAFLGYSSLAIIVYKILDRYFIWMKEKIIIIGLYSYSLFLIHWFMIKFYIYFLNKIDLEFNFYLLLVLIPITLYAANFYEKLNSVLIRKLIGN